MNRSAELRRLAEGIEYMTSGAIKLEYTYSPGDRQGRRWVFSTRTSSRTLLTREVRPFLEGIQAGYSARSVEGWKRETSC